MLRMKCQIAIVLLAMLVMAVAMPAYAQTETVLYEFGDFSAGPGGVVSQGANGAVYLTTSGGATLVSAYGGIYKITPAGKVTDLYEFCTDANCTNGRFPLGGVTLRPDEHFLGTAEGLGGPNDTGAGTIFDVSETGLVTTLYVFTGGADGSSPQAAPTLGADGSFYGVTFFKGGSSNCGTIYRWTSAGFTLLYQFDNVHGCNPAAPMILGTDGNLYGTTLNGGTEGGGVVFQLKLRSGKSPVVTVLANFDETNGHPWSPLVQGNDGDFYGTTSGSVFYGETGAGSGTGTVFKITASGNLTVLHTLNGTTDGANPYSGLVQATDGNFYGTALSAGFAPNASLTCVVGCGTIFQITPAGTYAVLYSFDGFTGDFPIATPVQHTNGLLYGDTLSGGGCDNEFGCGVIYSFDNNLPPFVKTIQLMGSVGSSVEILGQGFNSSTTVSFNGTAAEVNLQSATSLWTKVPAGATTGLVTVTTSSGPLNSNRNFIVTP